jgi:membrane-bound lytic murein transglycosylase F
MQLVPNTAAHFGADSIINPQQNLSAGVSYLSAVIERWDDELTDSLNLIKFVLASYNAGVGHVQDAARLAKKNGDNPSDWEAVSPYLLKLSNPEFHTDEVVKYGYCRGIEPVNHVEKVISLWEHYKTGFD